MDRSQNDFNFDAMGNGSTRHEVLLPGGGWLRSVVENSSEIVIVVDSDGTLRYANPAFGRTLGCDPVDAVGKMNVLDHVHPEDLPHVFVGIEEALSREGVTTSRTEYRIRALDGSWRLMESVGTYLLDDPHMAGVVVTSRDATERVRINEQLRFQAQLLGAVGEAVVGLGADGEVVYWNRAAEEMYGWSAGEAMGHPFMEIAVPDDFHERTGEVMSEVSAGRPWSGELFVRRRDGSIFPIEATNTPVFGENGVPGGVISVMRDLSARKEAEEALRQSEAELFTVLESITDGFFVLDREWRFAYVNAQAAAMLERTREDLVGERIWEDPAFYPRYRRAVQEDRTASFEAYYPPLKRWYSVRAYPSKSGLSVHFQDVTERKEVEKRYRTLVEQIPAIVYIHELGEPSRTTYVSPQNETILGYPPEQCTADPDHWIRIMHPEDREAVLAEDARSNETGEDFAMEYRQFARDGRLVWLRDEATLVRDESGEPLYWLGVQIDVTERKEAERRLSDAEERYRTLVERIPAVTYVEEVGATQSTLYMSPQIEDLLGYPQEAWLGDGDHWKTGCIHPEDRERVLAANARSNAAGEPFRSEYRLLHRDGGTVWVHDEAVLVQRPGRPERFWQGVLTDITERKALEERLEYEALHDPLTRLPNRRLFVDRLGQALRRTRRREGVLVAVLFMDLDGFKVVNDSLGHDVGDLLLTVVAQRLRRCLRPEDTLARFGGDEFVVLLDDVEDPSEAVHVAERITDELRRPFTLEGRELYVSASVGISFSTSPIGSQEDLLRDADTAMYRAKEEGGGFRVFDPAMHQQVARRLDLENDLRRAVERNEFVLHYQPVIDLGNRHVWGMEALVRWEHPERGLLGPSEFVAVAEETGLIVPIGGWALEEACRRTKEWQDAYPQDPPLRVIVNLSARQLRHPACEESIMAALAKSGLGPEFLSLDVTETALVDVLEDNRAILERIQASGVKISIDDFGMGYSSLSYLKGLPADYLKIDRSFVRNFGEDAEDTALVGMVIGVGHTLGMGVIAEGVERWAQAALLAETGCDMAQGYHFSGPLTPDDVPGFLRGQPSS